MASALFRKGRKVNDYDLFAGHAWYVPGTGGIFVLLAWFLAGSLLASTVLNVLGLFTPPAVLAKYSMLVAYPLSFLPAMVYVSHQSRRNSFFETGYKLESGHFGPFKAWQMALITIFLTFATMIAADLPNYWNYRLSTLFPFMNKFYESVQQMMKGVTDGPFWSSFLLAAVFAPVFEEWLCRGMVLRGLLVRMKPAWAIVVSALFFAVIHINPWQALNAFFIGVVMGYVYYKSGSLLLTMLIHFVNNATPVIMSQFPSLEGADYWLDILPAGVYAAVYAAGLCVLAACLLAFRRIPLAQKRGNIDSISEDGE